MCVHFSEFSCLRVFLIDCIQTCETNHFIKMTFLDFHGFDFRNFRFNAVYNSILFFTPLVILSNIGYMVFASTGFLWCPHINSVNRGMPVVKNIFKLV